MFVFRKPVWKTQALLKYVRNNGCFTPIPLYFYDISVRSPQNEKIFRQELQTKSKYISTFNKFVQKSCRLWGNVKKYGRARQATDDNMARAMYMLCDKGYMHTFIIWNTHCFAMATKVTQKHLSVTVIQTLPVLVYRNIMKFRRSKYFGI